MASTEANCSAQLSVGVLFFLVFLSFGKEFDYDVIVIIADG